MTFINYDEGEGLKVKNLIWLNLWMGQKKIKEENMDEIKEQKKLNIYLNETTNSKKVDFI